MPPFGEVRQRIKSPQQKRCCDDAIAVVPAALDDLDPVCIRPTPEAALPAPHLFQQEAKQPSAFRTGEFDVVESVVQGTCEPLG